MKIKHLFVAVGLTAVLFVSACSGGNDTGLPEESSTPSPTQGSTEALKQTLIEMNKVIKGTLVAKY